MPDVLTRFARPVTDANGVQYFAQACGAGNSNRLWEGWIEFIPADGGVPLRSPRETTQPNRTDTEYWASGLTFVYLEGALHRAMSSAIDRVDIPTAQRLPNGHSAVLNPFSVYEKGETILRQELRALSPWHLVNIIVAYRLSPLSQTTLNAMLSVVLVELIVSSVRE